MFFAATKKNILYIHGSCELLDITKWLYSFNAEHKMDRLVSTQITAEDLRGLFNL